MQTSPAGKLILIVALFSTLLAGCAMNNNIHPDKLHTLIGDIDRLNQALQQNPDLLSRTRLIDVDLSGIKLQNAVLEKLNWTNVRISGGVWKNVLVKRSKLLGVEFLGSEFSDVVFEKLYVNIDTRTRGANTSFAESENMDIYFRDSELVDVDIYDLKTSRLTFDNTTIKNDPDLDIHQQSRGGLAELQAEIRVINKSVLDTGLVSHTKYPSEVILENSKLIGGISGELKRLEIRDSQYYGRGGDRADYVFIENSTVDTGFNNSRFVHLKNNVFLKADGKSLPYTGLIKVEHAVLEGCKYPIRLGMVHDTHVQNLHVRDCTIIEPYLSRAHVGRVDLCNSVLEVNSDKPVSRRTVWDGSQIAELNFYNTRFEGELSAIEDLQIGTLGSDGKHPVPAQLQQAADAQKSLGDCPPLPDVDALSEKALRDAPPPELSSLFWSDLLDGNGQRLEGRPMPFSEVRADSQQLHIRFDPHWLAIAQRHYSLGPGSELPPLRSAVLARGEEIPAGGKEYPGLILKTAYRYPLAEVQTPDSLSFSTTGLQSAISPGHYHLLMWFDPADSLPQYDHKSAWLLALRPDMTQAAVQDSRWPDGKAWLGYPAWSRMYQYYSSVELPDEPIVRADSEIT